MTRTAVLPQGVETPRRGDLDGSASPSVRDVLHMVDTRSFSRVQQLDM